MDVRSKHPSLWIISGQIFDRTEPARSSCQYGSKSSLRFVLKIASISQFSELAVPKLAVQGRYNQNLFLAVLPHSLQGIAERPLPCNYNVIQQISALSRR
jgi:hypothetical protein